MNRHDNIMINEKNFLKDVLFSIQDNSKINKAICMIWAEIKKYIKKENIYDNNNKIENWEVIFHTMEIMENDPIPKVFFIFYCLYTIPYIKNVMYKSCPSNKIEFFMDQFLNDKMEQFLKNVDEKEQSNDIQIKLSKLVIELSTFYLIS